MFCILILILLSIMSMYSICALSAPFSSKDLTLLFEHCLNQESTLLIIVYNDVIFPNEIVHHFHQSYINFLVIGIRQTDSLELSTYNICHLNYQILIFVEDPLDIWSVANQTQMSLTWNSAIIFGVIMKALHDEDEEELNAAIKFMCSGRIIEMLPVVIFWHENVGLHQNNVTNISEPIGIIQVFTYHPHPFHCIKYKSNYINDLCTVTGITNQVFGHQSLSHRPNGTSTSKNTHCQVLKVALFPDLTKAIPIMKNGNFNHYEGSDAYTVQVIAEYLNLNIVWIPQSDNTNFGYRDINGTITGTSGDVAYGRADIAANSRYIKLDWPELEYTYPHDTDSLCFLVPKSKRVPQYKNIFLPFSNYVWIALLCIIFLSSVTWYWIRNFYNSINITAITAFLDIYGSLVIGMFNLQPNLTIERLYIIVWVMCGIIITSSFQGSLTSFLSVPKYLKDINNLHELDMSGFSLIVYKGINSIVTLDPDNYIMKRLWKKFKYFSDFSMVLDLMIEKQNMGCMFNEYSARYFHRMKKYTKDGYPLLHWVKENFLTFYSVYEVPRNSPYLHKINVVITRLLESGIRRKWDSDVMYQAMLQGNITNLRGLESARLPSLSLYHMQTAFYILTIGLFGSLLEFAIELFKY